MAIIDNFWLKGARKKLGGAVIYEAMSETRARALAAKVHNPRTEAQMYTRVKWANLVAFYRLNSDWMKYAYENKKRNQTEYNRFMQLNVRPSDIYLTKQEAEEGSCVVNNYIMTQGSLQSITYTDQETYIQTNLFLSNDSALTGESSVAAWSGELVANNPGLEYGDQLSFLRYTQMANQNTGSPYAILRKYEFIISDENLQPLSDFWPTELLQIRKIEGNSVVTVNHTGNAGGLLMVLSRTIKGKTYVSTQAILPVDNEDMIAAYSSQKQYEAAIDSYGSTPDAFLDSKNADVAANGPIELNILAMSSGGQYYRDNDYIGEVDSLVTNNMTIQFNGTITEDVTEVAIILDYASNRYVRDITYTKNGNTITVIKITLGSGQTGKTVSGIQVKTTEATYTMNFSTSLPSLE